ncbi:MAG: hypothetical protein FJW30_12810 [Acidobacteria bacterium]|nr:hypothetical protein [Acidobacteriota bacterium]
MRTIYPVAAAAAVLIGCATAPPAEPVKESSFKPVPVKEAPKEVPKPATPKARQITVKGGAVLVARVSESMTSEKNEVGDTWTGVLSEPLISDGLVIAEKGSPVTGRVSHLKRAGKVKGNAELSIQLTRFTSADGQKVEIATAPFLTVGKDTTKKDTAKIAIATGVGAAIGAIAGKGKGAAIGAGAGAAGGTGVVLTTRGGPATIASETIVRFRVRDAVTITEAVK